MAKQYDSRFKDDWNINKEFLCYMMEVVERMGVYRAEQDCVGWHLAGEELIGLISGLIPRDRVADLKSQLDAINKRIKRINNNVSTITGQLMFEHNYEIITKLLSRFTSEAVLEIHKARLILPKADVRSGFKQMREDFGIE